MLICSLLKTLRYLLCIHNIFVIFQHAMDEFCQPMLILVDAMMFLNFLGECRMVSLGVADDVYDMLLRNTPLLS